MKRSHFRLCRTITYNDFWWDNMAVATDDSSAIMFDYNCVYRGYAYSEEERAFEDVYFPLTGLISACRMETLPAWAANFSEMPI